jgi:outer membrane lipoprotein-sorting protein
MSVILALATLLQDTTAEEAFSRIAAKLEKAATLRIVYSGEAVAKGRPEAPMKYSGTLLLKSGNRASWEIKIPTTDPKRSFTYKLVSDGTKLSENGRPGGPVPEGLGAPFLRALGGCGIFYSYVTLRDLSTSGPAFRAILLRHAPVSSGFRMGTKSGNVESLFYDVREEVSTTVGVDQTRFELAAQTIRARLSFDRESLRPLERTLTFRTAEDKEVTLAERYSVFEVDADLPDALFKVP